MYLIPLNCTCKTYNAITLRRYILLHVSAADSDPQGEQLSQRNYVDEGIFQRHYAARLKWYLISVISVSVNYTEVL